MYAIRSYYDIPDSHPKLEGIRKRKQESLILSIVIGFLISSLGYVLILKGNPWNIVSTDTLEGIIPPTLFIIWGIVFAVAIYLNIRITSYNVCYTKLLRCRMYERFFCGPALRYPSAENEKSI